jgi:hypothetical protein
VGEGVGVVVDAGEGVDPAEAKENVRDACDCAEAAIMADAEKLKVGAGAGEVVEESPGKEADAVRVTDMNEKKNQNKT